LVLRRPVESAQYSSEQFQTLLADHRVTCSISRSGNVWDNAAMGSFFSSMKTKLDESTPFQSHSATLALGDKRVVP
jgi:putative transposase